MCSIISIDCSHGNFARDNMRYYSRYNPEWQRIEMYAVARARQDIRFADIDAAFQWQKDEKILVEISRKFDPLRLQEQLRFFDLGAVEHFTDPREWFSVLLFKKKVKAGRIRAAAEPWGKS